MTSNKPYLIRALNEWIIDNDMTPFLLVDAEMEGVEVPEQYVEDGKIILNVAVNAVENIQFENEWIFFSARFNGRSYHINVPVNAVLAIYAKENGQGLMFAEQEMSDEEKASVTVSNNQQSGIDNKNRAKGPSLRVVK